MWTLWPGFWKLTMDGGVLKLKFQQHHSKSAAQSVTGICKADWRRVTRGVWQKIKEVRCLRNSENRVVLKGKEKLSKFADSLSNIKWEKWPLYLATWRSLLSLIKSFKWNRCENKIRDTYGMYGEWESRNWNLKARLLSQILESCSSTEISLWCSHPPHKNYLYIFYPFYIKNSSCFRTGTISTSISNA